MRNIMQIQKGAVRLNELYDAGMVNNELCLFLLNAIPWCMIWLRNSFRIILIHQCILSATRLAPQIP